MFGYLEHVCYVMYVCQEGFYNPIYFCLLIACSLCNVCVSGGVLQSEITFVWGATIRIFSLNSHESSSIAHVNCVCEQK